MLGYTIICIKISIRWNSLKIKTNRIELDSIIIVSTHFSLSIEP